MASVAGLSSFPRLLPQDQLVASEIRNGSLRAGVLGLELLQALDLVDPYVALTLAPAVVVT